MYKTEVLKLNSIVYTTRYDESKTEEQNLNTLNPHIKLIVQNQHP
jgi:hypothetical protein